MRRSTMQYRIKPFDEGTTEGFPNAYLRNQMDRQSRTTDA